MWAEAGERTGFPKVRALLSGFPKGPRGDSCGEGPRWLAVTGNEPDCPQLMGLSGLTEHLCQEKHHFLPQDMHGYTSAPLPITVGQRYLLCLSATSEGRHGWWMKNSDFPFVYPFRRRQHRAPISGGKPEADRKT